MNSIGKLIEALRGPVDTFVYLGAGRGDVLPQVFALGACQAILVEGDAENAAALHAATAARQEVRVVSRVVTPQGGTVTWHRYDLPALNCPLEVSGLKAYYPRLRELEHHAVNSTAIGALLDELAIETGGPAILVIDLPGQEDALLAACSSEQLRRFDAIVLRGCARALYEHASLAPEAVERLRMQQFAIQSADTETEPLWQATLLHFDRQAYEREQLREALTQVAKARDEQAKLVQEREVQLEQLAQAKGQLERAIAERDVQIAQIAKARDEQSKLAQDRQTQIEQATKAHQQQAASAADRIAESERQSRERQAKLVELQREVAQLEEEQRSASKRQQMLYEELLKAEAQLELIKDVTLREPGL